VNADGTLHASAAAVADAVHASARDAAALAGYGLHVALDGVPVLHGVSIALQAGQWCAIVGPNGAGKSTLLRALAGLLPLHGGEVRLLGRPLGAWPQRERAQRLAWLAQQQADSAQELSVQDVVALGRLPHLGLLGAPRAADLQAVQDAMRWTECEPWGPRRMGALSGGERQRALLARALAVQAPVLLLDEPTTHLDPPHQVALLRLLQRLVAERGMAVAAVLHDLSLALQADRLLVLDAGRVCASGAPHDPAVRNALESVFHHAIRIARLEGDWVAVPRVR
jgi:iron complex transport system ATP-binding protein